GSAARDYVIDDAWRGRLEIDHADGVHVPVDLADVGHESQLAVGSDVDVDRLLTDRHVGFRVGELVVGYLEHRDSVVQELGGESPTAVRGEGNVYDRISNRYAVEHRHRLAPDRQQRHRLVLTTGDERAVAGIVDRNTRRLFPDLD